eukprot:TRINITY_DN111349_c0_g1_i1.p1 TRINITY_DN111349_c0_g1~~TRINITY_DN111349_c0_g1_i1.p1  ORF type:complete len:454 (-),score=116.27 TRINITY_DN111349_c0_g1_i1:67-1428(-)
MESLTASLMARFLLLLTWSITAAASSDVYAMIADAGSTGTRVYLFHLPASGNEVDIKDIGKGPALSSFQDSPEKAMEAVRPQLVKAKDLIPKELQARVPVKVFATAGMRLVPKDKADAIYRHLVEGLGSGAEGLSPFPFDGESLTARTISGREEGIFALLAANYLAKHMRHTLDAVSGELMGVLDLGGSSTQVAAPPALTAGENLVPRLGETDTFVKSYLKLGMERMRQRTFQHFIDSADEDSRSKKAVQNPCSFDGYSETGEFWLGKGEANLCEAAISKLLKQDQVTCSEAGGVGDSVSDCLSSEPVYKPQQATKLSDEAHFFLISGYMYVTDFARWWLVQSGQKVFAHETPTIAELREAAKFLCGSQWASLSTAAMSKDKAARHRFTPDKKVPHRCFEINYVTALLSTGYGFGDQDRIFKIVEDINGGEIEWTLGAFLFGLSSGGAGQQEL